jgi:hypothetical protein
MLATLAAEAPSVGSGLAMVEAELIVARRFVRGGRGGEESVARCAGSVLRRYLPCDQWRACMSVTESGASPIQNLDLEMADAASRVC